MAQAASLFRRADQNAPARCDRDSPVVGPLSRKSNKMCFKKKREKKEQEGLKQSSVSSERKICGLPVHRLAHGRMAPRHRVRTCPFPKVTVTMAAGNNRETNPGQEGDP